MKIAITTPTGHIGRQLTELIIDNPMGHEIVLLVRDRTKVMGFADRGAIVREGDQNDRKFVHEATKDIDTLFWVIPPNFQTTDVVQYYHDNGKIATDAIWSNQIHRAILISSIGAHLGIEGKTGPVKGFKAVEEMFRAATDNLVIARPTYFMENLLMALDGIVREGKMYLPAAGEAKTSMIATADIAEAVAGFIRQPFNGTMVMPLHGPRDYTFNEAAAIIGKALGRKVEHVQVPPEAVVEALAGMGVSRHLARSYIELADAINHGRLRPEFPRSQDTTTTTTLEQFAQTVVVPMVRHRQGAAS